MALAQQNGNICILCNQFTCLSICFSSHLKHNSLFSNTHIVKSRVKRCPVSLASACCKSTGFLSIMLIWSFFSQFLMHNLLNILLRQNRYVSPPSGGKSSPSALWLNSAISLPQSCQHSGLLFLFDVFWSSVKSAKQPEQSGDSGGGEQKLF